MTTVREKLDKWSKTQKRPVNGPKHKSSRSRILNNLSLIMLGTIECWAQILLTRDCLMPQMEFLVVHGT